MQTLITHNYFASAQVVNNRKCVDVLIAASVTIYSAPALRRVFNSDLSAKIGSSVDHHVRCVSQTTTGFGSDCGFK